MTPTKIGLLIMFALIQIAACILVVGLFFSRLEFPAIPPPKPLVMPRIETGEDVLRGPGGKELRKFRVSWYTWQGKTGHGNWSYDRAAVVSDIAPLNNTWDQVLHWLEEYQPATAVESKGEVE